MVTIAIPTMRKHPKVEWIFDALRRQAKLQVQIILIDFWKHERGNMLEEITAPNFCEFLHVEPLPSLVQGRHKITKDHWFSAANARNTALVYAKHAFVAYIDDVSAIGERWFEGLQECMRERYVGLGAYKKVRSLVVEDGRAISYNIEDVDPRWHLCPDEKKVRCNGDNLFGCSLVVPLHEALEINGWDCLTDTIGYEDTVFGIRLERNGCKFIYNKKMLTLESNDYPEKDFSVKRVDEMLGEARYKEVMNELAITRSRYAPSANKDCSHIIVDAARDSAKPRWNHFSLRELRAKAQRGEEIELSDMNYKDYAWYNKKHLTEL